MKTIPYTKYIQLEKYHHLDQALEDICPELLEDVEVRVLKERLRWARRALELEVYSRVEGDDW